MKSSRRNDKGVGPDNAATAPTSSDDQKDGEQENPKTTIEELTQAVNTLIQSQRDQEERVERDRAHQERRWKMMQQQVGFLQSQVQQYGRELEDQASQDEEGETQDEELEEELEESREREGRSGV